MLLDFASTNGLKVKKLERSSTAPQLARDFGRITRRQKLEFSFMITALLNIEHLEADS